MEVHQYLFLISFLTLIKSVNTIYFKQGSEYRYDFYGVTAIDNVKSFKVNAKIGIIGIGQFYNQSQECELKVHHYFVSTDMENNVRKINTEYLDFAQWLSFYVNPYGEIRKVFSTVDENPLVLAMKKIMLGALSSKLIISESQHKEKRRWAYKANEIGHEGSHESTYQAEPDIEHISFTKKKHTPPMNGGFHRYSKNVKLGVQSNVPEQMSITEAFATPKDLPPGYKTIIPEHEKDLLHGNKEMAMPAMGGNSSMTLNLEHIISEDIYLYRISDKPKKLIESTLQIKEKPQSLIPLATANALIHGNITCAVKAKLSNVQKERMTCFSKLKSLLKRLHISDLKNLTTNYKNISHKNPLMWKMYLDGLGAAQTNDTLEIMVQETLLANGSTPDMLMSAMIHFVGMKKCATKLILKTFEEKVFHHPWLFVNDTINTNRVNERAELVLGSLVSSSGQCNPLWVNSITRELETKLGVHDPYNHRMKRNAMTQYQFKLFVNQKALHILSLGNGRMDSSLKYYESFLNTSESHLHLRSSAVEALSKYNHLQAAEMLLTVIVTDEDETIRKNAIHAYERHPFGGSSKDFTSNITTVQSERVKRSLKNVLGRIWKGFEFLLKAPSVNYGKIIGGSQLGASIGLFMENYLLISVKPVTSVAKVSIHDGAYAMLHLGLVNFEFELFKAELCYKGEIKYDLNILAEYGFGDVLKFVQKYSKVVKNVVNTIKTATAQFQSMLKSFRDFDIGELFNSFIEIIKNMPRDVVDMKKIGRKLLKILDNYVDLPPLPVIDKVKELVTYVNQLLVDIKTDVMTLYNAIVDTITTTLPWAWNEIKEAFKQVVQSFKSIIRNPKKTIQGIGRGVLRITTAVGVILDAKNKLVEANIFAKEQQPYWFDVATIFENIKNKVSDISAAVNDTETVLQIDDDENEEAVQFLGIDMKTMIKEMLDEIFLEIKTGLLEGPVAKIKELLAPFIDKYEVLTSAITTIKEAWRLIVNGFRSAKTDLELIFGFKLHKQFPNKYLVSNTCGEGFWKSTGKDNYAHPGVDIDISLDRVVSPVNGNITQSARNQVTIQVFEMDETEIILENVKLNDALNGTEVAGGDIIGTIVKPHWCSDKHIHLSIRRLGGTEYIDPTRYMEKREMPEPKWVEQCDFYVLRLLGQTIAQGSLTKDAETKNETTTLPNAPSADDVSVPDLGSSTSRRRKRFLHTWVDNLKDFAESLNLPNIDDLKNVFNLNMGTISLEDLLNFLDKSHLTDLKKKIDGLLLKLQNLKNDKTCKSPSGMSDDQLKQALIVAGKSTKGPRKQLEKLYKKTEQACSSIRNRLGNNNWCHFDSSCLSVSCCVELKVFMLRYVIHGHITLDPCSQTITFGFDRWSKIIKLGDFAVENTEAINKDVNTLDIVQFLVYYKVKKEGNIFKVSFGVRFCSTYVNKCKDLYKIATDAEFISVECKTAVSKRKRSVLSRKKRQANELKGLLSMTTQNFLHSLDAFGFDENEIIELIQSITDAFQEWLKRKIQTTFGSILGDEFSSFDVCLPAVEANLPSKDITIYELEPPLFIPLGPVPCFFSFSINGFFGSSFQCELCILSMKAAAKVTPQIGSFAEGAFGLQIGPSSFQFTAVVQLRGYLLTTRFPTKAECTFVKFPIDVKTRMDMELVPLSIEMRIVLRLQISVKILTKEINIQHTLIDSILWKYQTPMIKKNIFNLNDIEKDETPPLFEIYPAAKSNKDANRKRRSNSNRTPECTVYQISGKDYTEAELFLGTEVTDDKSEVEMFYSIGTIIGGNDVIKDEPLGGNSVVQRRDLVRGVPLYVTIFAKNTQGTEATTTCSLPTYDLTLPTGRVTPEFYSTSHPNILRASVFMSDDTPIINRMISVGYGRKGDEIVDWHNFKAESDDTVNPQINDSDPLGYFANPRLGRLEYKPFFKKKTDGSDICAKECLSYTGSKCMSFNYDYGKDGTCELLEAVEGHVKLYHSGNFFHFQRYGIGHSTSFLYNVTLQHNTLVFFNMFLENQLRYQHHLTSVGILVDTTIPHPGYIGKAKTDVTSHEPCQTFTPVHLQHLCREQTPLPNFRYIIDGPESRTVFNGHKPLTDLLSSRSNTMVSANWYGFGDNETGIYVYTWSVGTEPCSSNVHPHQDPHAHITTESEWTHTGIAYPLNLKDGRYHVSVRALNNVEFGGPMAVTVCHATPYTIDTTGPIIVNITQAEYDEKLQTITLSMYTYDDLSGIKGGEIGLGRTEKDTYIMTWTDISNYTNISYVYKLPDGIPVWVKVRVTNNVDLREINHSPKPLFIDGSAPIGGVIYHGTKASVHKPYQSQTDELCVNWDGFHDPQSGIGLYYLAIGSDKGLSDIKVYVELPHDTHEYCEKDLNLKHNRSYYVTIIAVNRVINAKNVTVSSSGVMIDTSPPIPGWVKDGVPNEPDTMYSSIPTTVAVTWNNISDPESGLVSTSVSVFRKTSNADQEDQIFQSHEIDANTTTFEKHHFHLKHMDIVQTVVTSTNHANLSTSLKTDGYLIDLTYPVLHSLMDGYNVSKDRKYMSEEKLSASWQFTDEESEIAGYEFSSYYETGGTKVKVYPNNNLSTELRLPPSTLSYITPNNLSLVPGGLYFSRIVAINRAKLSGIHDTNGVILDFTPPKMIYVHAIVIAGEAEEVIDGFVYHSDRSSISGSWKATDHESGIAEYMVGIGTAPGLEDISQFKSFGKSENGRFTELSLQLGNDSSGKPVYYINAFSFNDVGAKSDVTTSSPIMIVPGDKAGFVWDGESAAFEQDIDAQLDGGIVTVHFSGFTSELHGIVYYEWAIGSRPRFDDVKPYSQQGLIIYNTNNTGISGLGSNGMGQLHISLQKGTRYYSSIRAITGAGNILDSSSDGFIIDDTPPVIKFKKIGSEHNFNSSVIYQKVGDQIEILWQTDDPESSIISTMVLAGTYPGAENVMKRISLENGSVPTGIFNPSNKGIPNIITVTTENSIGLTTTIISPPIVIDDSPPLTGTLTCPDIISTASLTCTWINFKDEESGISKFLIGVGKTEGDDSVISFKEISSFENSITLKSEHGLDVKHNQIYFVTLKAVSYIDLETVVYSGEVKVDTTPPIFGWIVELKDYTTWYENNRIKTEMTYGPESDVVCQRDLGQLQVAWQPFNDKESGIDKYEIGLGLTPGGTQIQSFKSIHAKEEHHIFLNLNLYDVKEAFVILKAYNKAGLSSTVISNGVKISRHSAGFPANKSLYVKDGLTNSDIDFQDTRDSLSANWDFSGDPCPLVDCEWSINRFDGKVILPFTKVPAGMTEATADEIELIDQQTYFVIVKATNALGYVTVIHSNGVTISLEPLLPGTVRDGNIQGVELSLQSSKTSLSGNWNGFGNDRDDGTDTNRNTEIGHHQAIKNYEVAAGTDRRYPKTKNNIHHFVNVGLNKTWTFTNLQLSEEGSVYYITVRAYSQSSSMVEVTSDGIEIVTKTGLISAGKINSPRFIASVTSITFGWSEFKFFTSVLRHYWGMKYGNEVENKTCQELLHESQFYKGTEEVTNTTLDIYPLTDVGLDTFITKENMKLVHGESYTLYIMAVDQAGICGLDTSTFTVDVTPPITGTIFTGQNFNQEIMYSELQDELTLRWNGFNDNESGIQHFTIALYSGSDCTSNPEEMMPIVKEIELHSNSTEFTFRNITLQPYNSYFIALKIENQAALSTETISKPILIDVKPPVSGKVIDGINFTHDVKYQATRKSVKGTVLYLSQGTVERCPSKTIDVNLMESFWEKIVHQGMWLLPQGQQKVIKFLDSQVHYLGENIVELTLQRDITAKQMISGAVQGNAEIDTGGKFEFEIKPAYELEAITSITFWDGPRGIFVDYTTNTTSTSDIENNKYLYGYQDPLDRDTYPAEYKSQRKNGNGFGFQIIATMQKATIILWSSNPTKTRQITYEIDAFDPTVWHKFVIAINDDEVDSKLDWTLKLFVDNKMIGILSGIEGLENDAQILIGTYRLNNELPKINDLFQPPTTKGLIKISRLPPPTDALCRHGLPFQATDNAIVKFYAAVGSTNGASDIVNFTEVESPCIPCVHKCDSLVCNQQCDGNTVHEITINIDNLDLDPFEKADSMNNTELLKAYFLTVKGVTGSGREAVSSSNGFYIDDSPPVINEIFHLDPLWSTQEPITFQGNNNTISVYWDASEDYSQILEYKWSVGTSKGGTDIQDFTSTATETVGTNANLLGILKESITYYVTVQAYNEAGQFSQKSSNGVTVLLTPPHIGTSQALHPHTQPIVKSNRQKSAFSSVAVNSVMTEQQDTVSCSWDITSAQDIGSVYSSIGTSKHTKDIFSETQVALNNSGILTVSSAGAAINNESIGNLSNFAKATEKELLGSNSFWLERGRHIYCNMRACNKAHVCSLIPSKSIMIIGKNDTIEATGSDGYITITKQESQKELSINIHTANTQNPGTYLVLGLLSSDDLQKDYMSSGSDNFTSFVSNPRNTFMKTERDLYQRWQSITNISFYMGSLPEMEINGPVIVTVNFGNNFDSQNDVIPTLMAWCPDQQIWIDTTETCDVALRTNTVNWNDKTLSVSVCNIDNYCSSTGNVGTRSRRQVNSNGVSRTKSLVVAGINTTTVNYPPYVTSTKQYDIYEDSGTVEVVLNATDPENDPIEFILDTTHVSQGSVTISKHGLVSYKPCEDCTNVDEVHFLVKEKQTGSIQNLITEGILTFRITAINDNPETVVLVQGHKLQPLLNSINTVIMTVNNNVPARQPHSGLDILISAYDTDADQLKFYFEPPSHGDFSVEKQRQTTESVLTNCNIEWSKLKIIWDEQLSKFYSFEKYSMPVPCSLNKSMTHNMTNWMLSAVLYTPRKNYIGQDSVKMYAADVHGSASLVLTLDIYILANPCWNNATCYKPQTDYSCTATERSQGFDGYICNCTKGYSGTYCDIDINECASNPCSYNSVCIDEIGKYSCQPSFKAWIAVLISLILAAIAGISIFCVWWHCCRKGNCTKVNWYDQPNQSDTQKILDGKGKRPSSKISLQDVHLETKENLTDYTPGLWALTSRKTPDCKKFDNRQQEKHEDARSSDSDDDQSSGCDIESRPVTSLSKTATQEKYDLNDQWSKMDQGGNSENYNVERDLVLQENGQSTVAVCDNDDNASTSNTEIGKKDGNKKQIRRKNNELRLKKMRAAYLK